MAKSKNPFKGPGGKGPPRARKALAKAYEEYQAAAQKHRIQRAKMTTLLQTGKWLSPLQMSENSVTLARNALASLAKEREFHATFFMLAVQYPGLVKVPHWVQRRVIQSAADFEQIENYLQESLRNLNTYREAWKKAVPRLLTEARKNKDYGPLRETLRKSHANTLAEEKSFDLFAQHVWENPNITEPMKLQTLAEAEKTVVKAKEQQEIHEIRFLQFLHHTAIASSLPPSYVDELARQMYVHRQLLRMYQTGTGRERK